MRHRRAERCLLRAEAALAAGLEAEARAALDEARGLNPETPSFDELLAAARIRREAEVARRRRQGTLRAALVAAAGLIVFLGIGWILYEPGDVADVETLASAPEPVPRPVAETTTSAPLPETSQVAPPTPASIDTPPASSAGGGSAEPEAPAARETPAPPPPVARERPSERKVPDSRPSTPAGTRPLAAPETPAQTTTQNIARPRMDASLEPGTLGAPLTESMNAPTAPPVTARAPEAASAPPEPVSQEPAVRAVLARFASAYSSLSASEARQVWPSVDARALSRAFEGLDSQQVSLGNCSVKVAASTARAECAGSATWTPKIGGGRRTEARRWEFDLARNNGGWLIVQARAR